MTKKIFSALFFMVALAAVRATNTNAEDKRDLITEPMGGCSKTCEAENPCKAGGDQFFFEHCLRRKFIQCDEFGGCFEKGCPRGTRWNQDFHACVHKRCG
eukprot:CAMPEP_0185735024 /NCGR_PEP_ID=MMETSP1171-20130828/24129_1 /TAXON_ID=374046 /ORGANISM="Helicotheca tamensis, Strain CCMP826" /LENGTH=99 /DNA_ID=CAMNT_0028405189 /DNA_START=68 /DNA_END=363 /DNA_ORIENTATION=+